MELMEMLDLKLSHEKAPQNSVKLLMSKFELIEVFASKKIAETSEKILSTKNVKKCLRIPTAQNRCPKHGQKVLERKQFVTLVGKNPYRNVAQNSAKKIPSQKIQCGITRQNNNHTDLLTKTMRHIK